MDAVITAGGRVDGEFAEVIGTPVKALARIGGRTLVQSAVDAARGAGAGRIAVVGGAAVRASIHGADEVLDESSSGEENLSRALLHFSESPLLFLTSDLPFVTAGAVREFLDRARADALAMPLASEAAYQARFPSAPEHVTEIAHERIANGSAFYIPAGTGPKIERAARALFGARKSLTRMALLLGPALLLKFALRRLTIADVEGKATALLGVGAHAVRDCAPELCFDVDTLDDYRYASAHA